jgi:2-haloacid dehalogenase
VADRWVTFDCYGTLIDWERGVQDALIDLWPRSDPADLLSRFHDIEPKVQAGTSIPYRLVLAETLRRLAEDARLSLDAGEEERLGASLPSWPAFPEVNAALSELRVRGWKLAILSNTDPDLLAASIERIGVPIGVPIDVRITAAEAGSYKPEPGHWERFFEISGADRDRYAHVGASLFHDIEPAGLLGLKAVWINRLGEATNLPREAELTDLSELPDTLEGIVAAEED